MNKTYRWKFVLILGSVIGMVPIFQHNFYSYKSYYKVAEFPQLYYLKPVPN